MGSESSTLIQRYLAAQVETHYADTGLIAETITSSMPNGPNLIFGNLTNRVGGIGSAVPVPPIDTRMNFVDVYIAEAAWTHATKLTLHLATGDVSTLVGQAPGYLGYSTAFIQAFPAATNPRVGPPVRHAHFDLGQMPWRKVADTLDGQNPLLLFGWLVTNGGSCVVFGANYHFTGMLPNPGALRAVSL